MNLLSVACLQLDLSSERPDGNLAGVLAGLERAASAGARLVVLPEMWPTSFEPSAAAEALARTERALERVAEASRRLALVVCGSAYGATGGPCLANRSHVLDRGELVAWHDKVHLFSPTAEGAAFAAGEAPPPVVATSVGRIAPLVCYDLRFPELARAAFRGGAEILVVCAQWPRQRAAHWRALVVGRAVEGQWFVVATNRTGRDVVGRRELELDFGGGSLVVGPEGEVLAEGDDRAGLVQAACDLASVARMRRAVPVARDERPELYPRWH